MVASFVAAIDANACINAALLWGSEYEGEFSAS